MLRMRRVDVAATWRYAREQFAAVEAERDALKRELAETKAYYEMRHLQRERDICRAKNAERDLARPLH